MLRKLIKYEILADYRKYGAVFGAMLLISFLLLFFDKMTSWVNNNMFMEIVVAVFGSVFAMAVVLACGMVMVFATTRFYKNLVRDEGYLMHTLPVPTWKLIVSKLIAVYIWYIAVTIVVGICSGIAFGEPLWLFEVLKELPWILEESKEVFDGNGMIVFMIYMLVLLILAPAMGMLHIYFSLALGNLFSKHKLGMSVLMYFAIYIGEQIITSIFMIFISADMMKWVLEMDNEMTVSNPQMMDFANQCMLFSIIFSIIFSVGFYIASERIFAKKLNLE